MTTRTNHIAPAALATTGIVGWTRDRRATSYHAPGTFELLRELAAERGQGIGPTVAEIIEDYFGRMAQ